MEGGVDIILLAGGKCPKDLAERVGVDAKALIPLGGKLLYRYALDAVLEMPVEKRIIVYTGGEQAISRDAGSIGVRVLDEPGTIVDALFTAVRIFAEGSEESSHEPDLLIVSSDIPFVTSRILMDVLVGARELNADAVWPITEKSFVEAKFPGSKRTYVKTMQGTFTGGNVFLLKRQVLLEKLKLIDQLFRARKNPVRMASIMGFGVVSQVITGRISIPKMESLVSKRLGVTIRALQTPHAEVAVDLDKLSDLIAMEKLIQRTSVSASPTGNSAQPQT